MPIIVSLLILAGFILLVKISLVCFIPLYLTIILDSILIKKIRKLFSKGGFGIFLGLLITCAIIVSTVKVGKYCNKKYKKYWLTLTGLDGEKTETEKKAEKEHDEKIQKERKEGLYRFQVTFVKKGGTNIKRYYKIKKDGKLTWYEPVQFSQNDTNMQSFEYTIMNLIYYENEPNPCGFEMETRYKSKVNVYQFFYPRKVFDINNFNFVRCNNFDEIEKLLNIKDPQFIMYEIKGNNK